MKKLVNYSNLSSCNSLHPPLSTIFKHKYDTKYIHFNGYNTYPILYRENSCFFFS